MKSDWIWMPHPGHFICAKWCRFHLNTYVNGYIVSTVGEYVADREIRRILADPFKIDITLKGDRFDYEYFKVFGFDEIGHLRTYETMVFNAKKRLDIDLLCCPWEVENFSEIDFKGYSNAVDAYKGHLELCEEYDKKRNAYVS